MWAWGFSSIILLVSKIFLSVVIPCFEEMVNLQKGVLDKVRRFLDGQKFSYEVIIVDDGSKDGSTTFLREFITHNPRFHLIKNSHTGKAGAVTSGVLAAKGEYVLFTDMDQATPIEEVKKLLPQFAKGCDIVIGSRNAVRRGAPWTRLLMARGMMVLRRFLVGIRDISDTQCGFKMFKRGVAQKLFEKVRQLHNGFGAVSGSSVSAGFDVELLYLAQKMGYSVKEVPVHWLYVESRRVSPIKDSIDGLLDLIKIKFNDLRGRYS